jgi:hypothetical protein
MVFKLSNGDLSKSEAVENSEVNKAFGWYYTIKVKELNEMRRNIAEIKRMRSC